MKTVRQVLDVKGKDVWHLHPENTVYEALQLLAEKDVGALMVLENNYPVGIVSERDYARKVALEGRIARDTPIHEIMTACLHTIKPTSQIVECMTMMTEKKIRHLPVLEDDEIVGIISIGDVVKEVISSQEFTIEQLENYIRGS